MKKGGSDMFNTQKFRMDSESKNNCKWDEEYIQMNSFKKDEQTYFTPSLGYSKLLDTGDKNDDVVLAVNQNYSIWWEFKTTAEGNKQSRGYVAGFFLDDPLNPVIAGAQMIAAGLFSVATLATQFV